jgi:organic radical activating enzyme
MAKQLRLAKRIAFEDQSRVISALEGKFVSDFNFVFTRKCNLNCSFCHVDASPAITEHVNARTARKIFQHMKPLSEKVGVEVTFTGGEPLTEVQLLKELISTAKRVFGKMGDYRLGVITNGLLLKENEVADELIDIRHDVRFYVKIEKRFHSAYLTLHDLRYILEQILPSRRLRAEPDDISKDFTKRDIVAVGRAYNLPKSMTAFHNTCSQHHFRYELSGDEVNVKFMPVIAEDSNTFSIDASGLLHACTWMTWPLGNLAKQQLPDIVEALRRDEQQMAFLEMGPLGAAQVEGKLVQAVEILKEKGACGVCYALQQKLI